MRRTWLIGLVVMAVSMPALAERIVGFRVEGKSKLTDQTLAYLAHVEVGSEAPSVEELEKALVSSDLFKTVRVRLEPAEGGVIVVATLDDKHSWIIMPTLYILSTNWAVGLGFAENNLFGENRKLLLYGQLGSINSFFVAAYVIPSFRGTKLSMRYDVYLQHRIYDEYANPPNDPSSTALARTTTHNFFNFGAAAGWNFRWWLNGDLRLRTAKVSYRDTHAADDPATPLPAPSPDGWDSTWQLQLTADGRFHDHGVSDGLYGQLQLELPLPGLTSYYYGAINSRFFAAKRLAHEHMFQLRLYGNFGYHLPFHDEWTLGAATDLRGYPTEQFHGDVRLLARAEYSVPVGHIKWFWFRALGFFDGGYLGFHLTDPTNRNYLPDQVGRGVFRSDVGAGFRIYFNNIVLPLLGLDVGYGLENRATALYLQVGLTDL